MYFLTGTDQIWNVRPYHMLNEIDGIAQHFDTFSTVEVLKISKDVSHSF